MEKTGKEYSKILIEVLNASIKMAESNPVYCCNKWETEQETNCLNKGYIAGLHAAIGVIRASEFLVQDAQIKEA